MRERASVAIKWFSRAVEQDFARAQFMLGFMYEHGEGVEKDEREAAKLYTKVRDSGFVGSIEQGSCAHHRSALFATGCKPG